MLRTDFNITTGFQAKDMDAVKRKSRMKEGYAAAGVKTARYHLVDHTAGCRRFIEEVGYPVIVKPDNGVGASNTWKLNSDKELDDFMWTKPNQQFIMEEFVPGHIETFDGITDGKGDVIFTSGQVMARTLMDMLHGAGENVSYTQNVQETDLLDIGTRVVKAFNVKNRFFHFEFFRLDEDKTGLGQKDEIIGLEVNMRAPGGYIPDKMNYAYHVDVCQIWAESLVYNENRSFRDYRFRRYVTHVGRSGKEAYLHSPGDIRKRFGEKILLENRPPESISGGMGSYVFMLYAASKEELQEQASYILKHADGTDWLM